METKTPDKEPEINTVDFGNEVIEFTDEEMFGDHAGTVRKFRTVAGNIMSALAVIALAITLVAVGYGACSFNSTPTQKLAEKYANDADSPFTKEELVSAAVATKDYAFASNNKEALLEAIADINVSAAQDGRAGVGAPDMEAVPVAIFQETGKYDVPALEAAFAEASEQYVLTNDALAHLNDVFHVAHKARPILGMIGMGAAVACALVSNTVSRKRLGGVLLAAGLLVTAAFGAAATWAYLDFNSLFVLFHSFFFADGTWTFSADSLLICMFPLDFWIGMGTLWLGVTLAGSLICLIMGILLRKGYFAEEE